MLPDLIINKLGPPLRCHIFQQKNYPHHLRKYKGKWTKISILKLFRELWKIWECNLGFSKILISHLFYELGKTWKYSYTAQDQHFKIQILNLWMNWETLFPNLSFTVENNMGNSHKKGRLYFKSSIND